MKSRLVCIGVFVDLACGGLTAANTLAVYIRASSFIYF